MSDKPTVIHIYGFTPRADLHRALSKVTGLRRPYHFVTPRLIGFTLFDAKWTHQPLEHFSLKPYWRDNPLYLIQPAAVYMSHNAWGRVRDGLIAEHRAAAYELIVDLGMQNHYRVREIVSFNVSPAYL